MLVISTLLQKNIYNGELEKKFLHLSDVYLIAFKHDINLEDSNQMVAHYILNISLRVLHPLVSKTQEGCDFMEEYINDI